MNEIYFRDIKYATIEVGFPSFVAKQGRLVISPRQRVANHLFKESIQAEHTVKQKKCCIAVAVGIVICKLPWIACELHLNC